MVANIEAKVLETAAETGRSHLGQGVIDAMAAVPRERFVPEAFRPFAYCDGPLGIGYNQTISQPYIVALMTDVLNLQAGDRVLEVGTGSGYQAAVLSQCAGQVYSVEIVAQLAERAAATLVELGYDNVEVMQGNGYLGWPEQAPFDAVIVTAGGEIPPPLIDQLKPGGRMIIPEQNSYGEQYLTMLEKRHDGQVECKKLIAVRFVPLIGGPVAPINGVPDS